MAPLPVNFHRSFKPERQHIGALLRYAALGRQATLQEISAETGIPTGSSSGKVGPTLDYAKAMGLMELAKGGQRGVIRPILTAFGRVVCSRDPFLGHEVSQWLAHMNLCRGDMGASAWHAVFALGRRQLGSSFTRAQLEAYLVERFGAGNRRTGPLVTTYMDESSLGRARIVVEERGKLVRRKAPTEDAFATAYSALILDLMEDYFPGLGQVAFSDFNDATGWFDICLWGEDDLQRAFVAIERRGFVIVHRQRRPWILERRAVSEAVWPVIYDGLA